MTVDPFEPIKGPKKPKLTVVSESVEWAIVAPVPPDAPSAPAKHPSLGAPSQSWLYRDADGAALGYVHRFEREDGGKEFRPCALWRNTKTDALVWRWQAWPEPRPLYGRDRLADRPDAPVLLPEGEKSADAAARLLPEYVCIASPNGSRAAGKADWSPLAGRHIVIWPDADEPGAKYASEAAECINAAGAASVALVTLPADLPDGWDLANAEEEGWVASKISLMIRSASPLAGKAAGGGRRKASPKNDASDAEAGAKTRGVGAIIDLVLNANVTFWHDAGLNAFASYSVGGHTENHRVDSKAFERWIARLNLRGLIREPAASGARSLTPSAANHGATTPR
jgi:hypothetical protein